MRKLTWTPYITKKKEKGKKDGRIECDQEILDLNSEAEIFIAPINSVLTLALSSGSHAYIMHVLRGVKDDFDKSAGSFPISLGNYHRKIVLIVETF